MEGDVWQVDELFQPVLDTKHNLNESLGHLVSYILTNQSLPKRMRSGRN